MFERYKGTPRRRLWLLVRGVCGLVLAIPLVVMTLFYLLLELGNYTVDTLFEKEKG